PRRSTSPSPGSYSTPLKTAVVGRSGGTRRRTVRPGRHARSPPPRHPRCATMSHAHLPGRPQRRALRRRVAPRTRDRRSSVSSTLAGLRRWDVAAGLVLVGVFVLGVTAVRFAPPGSSVAVWWPAAGLCIAFLLATG